MLTKVAAEFVGTFWLVLAGCGSAVLAAAFPNLGIGFVGVSLAFGLTVLTGSYALGAVSGGHFNVAVSFGLWAGGRFPASSLFPYIVAQVLGAVAAAAVLTPASSRAHRLCGHRDRSCANADSLDQHPGDEHVGQSCPQHRTGDLRRWLGAVAALVVLGGADRRRSCRRKAASGRFRGPAGAGDCGTRLM